VRRKFDKLYLNAILGTSGAHGKPAMRVGIAGHPRTIVELL